MSGAASNTASRAPGDTPSLQHAENRYFLRFIGTNLEKMHDNTAVLPDDIKTAFTESVPAD